MNTYKSIARVALFLCATMSLASCGFSDSEEEDENEGGGSTSKGMLGRAEEQVALVRNTVDWEKAKEYRSNAEYTISKLKSPTQRRNLTTLLNINYCHSMDTIMHIIMAGECSNQHKLLDELYSLRNGADYSEIGKNSSLHNQVKESYDKHKKMLSFISGATTKQTKITSWNTDYDESTENTKKKEAATYLSSKPTCKSSINKLENIKNGSAFKNRRKDYCEKILELYLQKDSWTYQDEKRLYGRLNSTYSDKYPNDPQIAVWDEQIKGFKDSKQQ